MWAEWRIGQVVAVSMVLRNLLRKRRRLRKVAKGREEWDWSAGLGIGRRWNGMVEIDNQLG